MSASAVVAEPPRGGTIAHIRSVLPSLVPSAQRVARICAEQPEEVVNMSGADLAAAAGTSPATVSRTSQALGFRSFQHLRLLLMRDLGAEWRDDDEGGTGTAAHLRRLAESAGGMLQRSLSSVDPDAFDAAADAIARAPRLLIAGTGASHTAAQAAALSFVMNGRSCEAPMDGVAQQLSARVLAPGDVCLVVSSSGANAVTLAAAEAARQSGATVITATSFARSPIGAQSDLLLVAGARYQGWDPGTLSNSLVQLLLLSALQEAVAARMEEAVERARFAVRTQVADIVAEDGSADGGDD